MREVSWINYFTSMKWLHVIRFEVLWINSFTSMKWFHVIRLVFTFSFCLIFRIFIKGSEEPPTCKYFQVLNILGLTWLPSFNVSPPPYIIYILIIWCSNYLPKQLVFLLLILMSIFLNLVTGTACPELSVSWKLRRLQSKGGLAFWWGWWQKRLEKSCSWDWHWPSLAWRRKGDWLTW